MFGMVLERNIMEINSWRLVCRDQVRMSIPSGDQREFIPGCYLTNSVKLDVRLHVRDDRDMACK